MSDGTMGLFATLAPTISDPGSDSHGSWALTAESAKHCRRMVPVWRRNGAKKKAKVAA